MAACVAPGRHALGANLLLGRKGSNLRMAESKSAALPLGYGPISFTTAGEGPLS
jgi:hypothetical protein